MLGPSELAELAEVALAAAEDAARMIAASHPGDVEHKAGGASLASRVVTEIDRRSEELILGHLDPTLERFDLALLTEERADDGGRLVADHFWCIDPLDGTLPFIEGGPGHAVSIALVRRDGRPLIGVVCDPTDMSSWCGVDGGGVRRDGAPWRPPEHRGDVLSVFADRSFDDAPERALVVEGLEAIAGDLGLAGTRIHVGAGAVMNACGVLANPRACYVKFPSPGRGVSLWDVAATACMFREVGAVATDLSGASLELNRADSTLLDRHGLVFATDEDLAARLRRLASRTT